VKVEGKLTLPKGEKEGGFNWQKYLSYQGIWVELGTGKVELIKRGRGNPLMKWAYRSRDRMVRLIEHLLPQPQSAILKAIMLGDKDSLPAEVKNTFLKTGTGHILVVSGLHVGLILFILLVFFRTLGLSFELTSLLPHFGSLTGECTGRDLLFNEPLPEIKYQWELDLGSQMGTLKLSKSKLEKIQIPLHPFIGSIGVAPRFGRIETALAPGEYGGNMDCVETKEGAILYLPIWVKGAHLSFGDVHAAQGDGEICGVALETTAQVTLKLEVIKNKTAEWPRMENVTHIMVAGSARPLIDALRIAHVELVKWLVADYGEEFEFSLACF
ncbi:unnamed protein product, partial [marine sediment metagenome]